ncbi:SRPBCC family protein [Nocardioides solisilvae]|uniref:SRPBCC family protein n=1 Tax=Nocardioides solisilvae TaxID=1542435 RepID=UPI001EF3FC56|nr:SRPBCC family protein [Nocardioides solisilvae]
MTTPSADLVEPLIEETVEVAAPPERVWALVSDLPRMAEWSPQVVRTFLRGGRPVRLGTRMLNLNRRGLLVWPTQAKVVRLEPQREVAFRVKENGSTWSFALEPVDGGAATRVVQRREAPDGISALSLRLTDRVLGGQTTFQAELRAGMRQTLDRIRAEAERG